MERVPCLRYPVRIRMDQDDTQALIDSGSEVNAMYPTYAAKLGLPVGKTDVGTQKIDKSHLETFRMVIAGFSLQDKLGQVRFFQETFLLADTSQHGGGPEDAIPHPQQCRHTVCGEGACLEEQHSCRGLSHSQKGLAAAALNNEDGKKTFVV